MTTHPASRAPQNEAVDRLRRRAWQAYLEATRESEEYEATEHFSLMRDFLNHRERYFRELFAREPGNAPR